MSKQNDEIVRQLLAGTSAPAQPAGDARNLTKTALAHPIFGGASEEEVVRGLGLEKLAEIRDEIMVKVAEEAIQEAAGDLSTLLVKSARANGTLPGLVKQAAAGDELRESALIRLCNEIR